MAGYSGTPLAKKLGIQRGHRVYVHKAPEDYATLTSPLPEDVQIVRSISATTDLAHFFVTSRSALKKALQRCIQVMRPDATLWISWPKKASGVATEVTEDVIRAEALPLGLVDVKVCAIDEIWSGLKLVIRKPLRAGRS
jgi:hypothetical protein